MPGKCHFSQLWLSETEFNKWVKPVENDKFSAFCCLCKRTFDISNAGVFNLRLHAKGKKHISLVRSCSISQPILSYYSSAKPSSVTSTQVSSEAVQLISHNEVLDTSSPETSSTGQSERPSGISSFLLKDDILKSEIIWTMHKVMSHSSSRSHSEATELFPLMFPNDIVAKNMRLGKDKICYLATFGLGPYFQSELLNKLKDCKFIAISFDECLNQVVQKCQMDIQIRYWDNGIGIVKTSYLSSCFTQKATASDLLSGLVGVLASLDVPLKKIIHVSMDGPNVNLKMLRELKDYIQKTGCEEDAQMFDIGTCGLHVIHGAYKTAHKVTGWQIHEFLRSVYYFFRDTPSRRADYTNHSGSSVFAKKFCSIRWVENGNVLQRAVDMIIPLQKYIEGMGTSAPDSKTFKTIKHALSDPLLRAKLEFLISVVKDIEPFLVQFQANKPLLPLIHHELTRLVTNIGERFIKQDVLSAVKSSSHLVAINVDDQKILLPPSQVQLGFGASGAVRKVVKTVKELDVLLFKKECVHFLVSIFKKLCDKSPLNYKLVRGASCLSPCIMRSENLRKVRVTTALEVFVDKQHFSAGIADIIKRRYEELCVAEVEAIKAWRGERLDTFFEGLMKRSTIIDIHFIDFVRKILVMFHGNADVERGFSVNSECLTTGLEEKSLISQRIIYDAVINSGPGRIKDVIITKKMIHYAKCASSRRIEALEQKKLEKESEEKNESRLVTKIQELREKRKQILTSKSEELANLDLEMEEIVKKIKKSKFLIK